MTEIQVAVYEKEMMEVLDGVGASMEVKENFKREKV